MAEHFKDNGLFDIINGHLYFDGCDTVELAEKYGTPLYVMSETDIVNRFEELNRDFVNKYPAARVAYASKAFCSTAMYRICDKMGASIDVVSEGELLAAKKADFPAARIEFNGNNKLPHEIAAAIEYGVGRFIVDGMNEIPLIEEACKKQGKKANIVIRITPGVATSTHDYIVTGKLDSKFGIPLDDDCLLPMVEEAIKSEYLNFLGFHMHIGSQLFTNDAFLESLSIMLDSVEKVKRHFDYDISELNLGGGFGATYTDEERKPFRFFLDPMMEVIDKRFKELQIPFPAVVIEPGRSIVAEAGITLYTVGQTKEIKDVRKYISVDGGMGDNIRVPLYGAKYNGIIANKADKPHTEVVTVCGRYCESADMLMTDFTVPNDTSSGDIVCMYTTGAYGFSMASNYNNNPIPGVVMVKEGQSGYIVEPQTLEQIIMNHRIPDFI